MCRAMRPWLLPSTQWKLLGKITNIIIESLCVGEICTHVRVRYNVYTKSMALRKLRPHAYIGVVTRQSIWRKVRSVAVVAATRRPWGWEMGRRSRWWGGPWPRPHEWYQYLVQVVEEVVGGEGLRKQRRAWYVTGPRENNKHNTERVIQVPLHTVPDLEGAQ